LLAKLVDGEVKCVNDLSFTTPKTAEFAAIREALKVERSALVAVDGKNRNAMLSARNVDGVSVCRIEQLNAFELLNHRYLIVDRASLESFLSGACFGDAATPAAAGAKGAA
jgi:large subunit ribosomal protein L4